MARPKIPKSKRKDVVVQVRLPPDLLDAVDNFIRQQENREIDNRSIAIRLLLRQALAC